MLASLDDKVADADEKLRDFMAEIESMDAEEAKELEENPSLARSKMPGFVSGGHVLPATGSGLSGNVIWLFMGKIRCLVIP